MWKSKKSSTFFEKKTFWESKIDLFPKIEISKNIYIEQKYLFMIYFEHSFMSILHFCAFTFDLGSQISDLSPDSHISFIFSNLFSWFLAEFSIFFTRLGAKDSALKRATFPFLGFSNGLLVAEKFHFYCSKSVQKRD